MKNRVFNGGGGVVKNRVFNGDAGSDRVFNGGYWE